MNPGFTPNAPDSDQIVHNLLHALALTHERELTCVEVYTLLDYYVDLEFAGENVLGVLPLIALHLRICTECAEEHDILRRLLGVE